ncbi:MAG: hypothetical protein PHI29_12140 [Gallionella sp.]|nr:hypothetical protein [Gallionella sp.]
MNSSDSLNKGWAAQDYRLPGVDQLAWTQLQLYRYAEDIKELAHSHAELQAKLERMTEDYEKASRSKGLLENLLMSISEFNLITDNRGNILEVSSKCSALFGIDGESKRHIALLFEPADRVKLVKLFSEACQGWNCITARRLDLVIRAQGSAVRSFYLVPWVMSVPHEGHTRFFWSLRDPECI